MKTFTLNPDSSLTVSDDNGGKLDGAGKPMVDSWTIQRAQIAAHRRDKDFEAALSAGLSAADLAKLPARAA